MRSFTRQTNRESQLKKPEAVSSRHPAQLFRRFTIKGRFPVDKTTHQTRLVFMTESIQDELAAVGQELFKLRINRIMDAAQTPDRLAFAGSLQWQASGTISADDCLTL